MFGVLPAIGTALLQGRGAVQRDFLKSGWGFTWFTGFTGLVGFLWCVPTRNSLDEAPTHTKL